jgi:hypothetical protein
MVYKFFQKNNYEDFSSGRVILHKPKNPDFPVRLAGEIFCSINLGGISHNVPEVYDVFAVAIMDCGAFQQPQKCVWSERGNGA